jgi:3-dehydroquinate synthetase
MGFDKKVLDGKLRLILLKQLGRAYVSADFSPDTLNKVLDEIGS